MLALCGVAALLFTALGVWQVQRLGWKRDLIERVDARVHAPPVAAPPAHEWPDLDVRAVEYRRVRVSGVFLYDRETRVDALTGLGPGSWVLTPLRTRQGVVLVNRGFVPAGPDDAVHNAGALYGEVTITGLLRASEPGGRILRPNKPGTDRWFSRDVAAIATLRGLPDVAPFFIDAEAGTPESGGPRGGLTVVHFRNAHLAYAGTWVALALLSVVGLAIVRRDAN